MATTTNFGWETPDDTDLVKDGAAAMRTLGNSIDTSFVDLKGGTTGQILSKASNTDLDYTWITNDVGDITAVTAGTGISGGGTSGAVTITNSMATAIDAKGDLIVGTGLDTFDRLAVGSNGQYLSADSTTATGLKWVAAGSSPIIQIVYSSAVATGSSTNSTLTDMTNMSATITPTSASNKVIAFMYWGGYVTQNTTSTPTATAVMNLVRGTTEIWTQTFGMDNGLNTTLAKYGYFRDSAFYIDSPATTSARTYKCQVNRAACSQIDWNNCRMILMEVA